MPLVPFPAAELPVTDGRTVSVWQGRDGGLRVADDDAALRRARRLPAPACTPTATDGRLLATDCNSSGFRLVSLDDGRETVTPAVRSIRSSLDDLYRNSLSLKLVITGFGRRAIAMHAFLFKSDAYPRFDWTTGEAVPARPFRSAEIASLDTPTGVRPLCTPLRLTRHRERFYDGVGGETIVREPDVATYRGRHLLIRHGHRIRLATCGRRGYRVVGKATGMTPVLTRRYAAWTTQHRLFVLTLKSGRLRTFRSRQGPPRKTVHARLAGTDQRLWIQDAYGVRMLEP